MQVEHFEFRDGVSQLLIIDVEDQDESDALGNMIFEDEIDKRKY
jgi:hypothetical protein